MAITKWFDLSEYGVFVKVIEEQFGGNAAKKLHDSIWERSSICFKL